MKERVPDFSRGGGGPPNKKERPQFPASRSMAPKVPYPKKKQTPQLVGHGSRSPKYRGRGNSVGEGVNRPQSMR